MTTYPLRATKAILCLPPSASILQTSGSAPHGSSASDSRYAHSINASASFGLPTILSAGTDARIRCWNLSNPEQSGVIAWPCIEEAVPPNLHYM
ncbi:unnamed protein product [Protopolystoma xenopodis]|uniref:Uncharacterized protein n=1 Tax=Protopolystoma xenopodis TaxID=117903 RepID=A0A448XJU8_9PLAT|nr:unnamed protein product [Protopolystoma xenopodis]